MENNTKTTLQLFQWFIAKQSYGNSYVYSDFHENTWNVYLALDRENIFCRVGGRRRRRRRRWERRTNLARRWSALDSLGTKRSWNVLWKLLWKALRGTDRTGAPGSLLLHTCCHDDEEAGPPLLPLKPRRALHALVLVPLYLSLFARMRRVFSIDPRKYLVFHHRHRIRRRYFARSRLCFFFSSPRFFFFLRALILLGHISWTVFSSIETFSRRQAYVRWSVSRESAGMPTLFA